MDKRNKQPSKQENRNGIDARWMRDRVAAEYMGIATSTLWLYVKRGDINTYKPSAQVTVFKRDDLDQFIEARIVKKENKNG